MKVSVIIPTYNRPQSLKACLAALEKQSLSANWEVVVIDDGSKLKLEETVVLFEKSLRLKLIQQQNAGPASARNRGVSEARGEYIAFLDDDCEPKTEWLATLYQAANPHIIIGGQTINTLHRNSYAEASQQLVSFLYEVWHDTPWFFFTSNNFLVHKETFLKIGGFDEGFNNAAGEDREFCARWLNQGYELSYLPEAIIGHAHRLSLKSFWRQHFNYGKAAFRYRTKLLSYGVPLPKAKLGFYMAMLKYLMRLSEFRLSKRLTLSGIMVVAQLTTFLGYIAGRRSHD